MFLKNILFLFVFAIVCSQFTSCQRVTEGHIDNNVYTSEKFAFKTPSLGFGMKAWDKKVSNDQIDIVFENDAHALVAYEVVKLGTDKTVLIRLNETDPKALYKELFQQTILDAALPDSPNLKIVSEELLQIDEVGNAYFVFVIYPEGANYGASDGRRSDLEVGYLFSLCDDMLVVIRSQSGMLTDIARKHGSDKPNTNYVKEKLIKARENFYSLPKKTLA